MLQIDRSVRAKPVIRWAGSKRQIVSKLASYCKTEYLRYVEPFAGSCALFYELSPPAALLADKNLELIRSYEVLRTAPARLHKELTALKRTKSKYKAIRALNPERLSNFQRAVRFMYLNRYCFNGIYRTNLDGQFNVPFSASKTGTFPSLEQMKLSAELLKRADLRCWDFGTTMRWVREGDLVYLDPPYAVESRRVFREYGASTFAKKDLTRLMRHLQNIDDRKARFLLSYADCQEARAIATEWYSTRIRVRRNVAGFEGARKTAYELLIANFHLNS